jgi:molybdate transport system ATP-binding protein
MTPRFDLDFRLLQGGFTLEIAERSDARALALFGPSGSGKTTVIEAIAGLRTPAEGRVVVGGRTLFSRRDRVNVPVQQRRVGYVPQDVLLFPHLDVRRNVTYGVSRGSADVTHIIEVLELRGLMDRRVASLSGGERQRVALARALASAPDVLLLDEPMAAVDLGRRRRILDALVRIREELRVPLVYVAHAPEEVRRIADRVLVIDNGRITAAGDSADVIST